jgi:hypothetical protein
MVSSRLSFALKVFTNFSQNDYWCLHALNGCFGQWTSLHYLVVRLWLSAMLEKVIVFCSHYALRFLCTMHTGSNS